ncbi:uncharacterized protein LOC124123253 isoform X2 [Haliotis rufescens]|uniref:uncharacterized protein LOC124123253 isoform X2 n=1 Tax=Haliotis rufescens TaxID=6454 RepID=UPI00201E93FE|nr:uncharacterized protein LOC124123253 isoform X2 [Haliotis rufescens]
MLVMVSRRGNTHGDNALILMLLVMVVSYSTEHVFCPEISQLGMPVNLTCNKADNLNVHSYLTPSGNPAASCDLADGRCVSQGDFTASVINTTSSVLTIPSVLQSHGGDWACVADADDPRPSTCRMTVAKFPSFNMVSVQESSSLTVGRELKVNITGFFCSEDMQLELLTVMDSYSTPPLHTTADITERAFNTTGTQTKLLFTCGSHTQSLSCEGVQQQGRKHAECPSAGLQLSSLVLGMGTMFMVISLCLGFWCICRYCPSSGGRTNENDKSDDPDKPAPVSSVGSGPGDDAYCNAVLSSGNGYASLKRRKDYTDTIYDVAEDYILSWPEN